MASSTSSSSYSSPIPRSLNDVFLSFRGPDTRTSFTSHLLAALEQHGFSTLYDTKLPRGEPIGSELVKAIEESRVSIVVFSKNYAASRWCLDELVKIMECKRDFKRIVLPIFYDVDPSHVRAQLGSYSEAFAKHEDGVKEGMRRVKIMERWTALTQIVLSMFNYNFDPSQNRVKERRYPMERVESWRTALTEAANLLGYHLQNGDEARFINTIVKDMDTFRRLDGVGTGNLSIYELGRDVILQTSLGNANMVKRLGLILIYEDDDEYLESNIEKTDTNTNKKHDFFYFS